MVVTEHPIEPHWRLHFERTYILSKGGPVHPSTLSGRIMLNDNNRHFFIKKLGTIIKNDIIEKIREYRIFRTVKLCYNNFGCEIDRHRVRTLFYLQKRCPG